MHNEKFPYLQLLSNSLNLHILEHGYLKGDSNWNYPAVTSPFNRIYFVVKGEGFIRGPQGVVSLTEGNMYLIPCHTTYDYYCETEVEKFYIHFRLEYLGGMDFFEKLKACKSIPFDKKELDQLIKQATSTNLIEILDFKASFLKGLTLFDSEHIALPPPQLQAIAQYQPLLEYIRNHCQISLTPQQLADVIHFTPSSLTKKFKRDMGFTPKYYLQKQVMEKGKELLLCSTLSIKEIAYQLGFKDEFYFSRFFKKNQGVSPLYYRQNNRF